MACRVRYLSDLEAALGERKVNRSHKNQQLRRYSLRSGRRDRRFVLSGLLRSLVFSKMDSLAAAASA
jgi:hypothetical protein